MAIPKILQEIEEDCIQLEKEGFLTEYGKGQLDLIKILKTAQDTYAQDLIRR